MKKALAIDVGGTKIYNTIIDDEGKILADVEKHHTPKTFSEIKSLFKSIIEKYEQDVDVIAFSTCGAVNNSNTGILGSTGNIAKEYPTMKKDISKLYDAYMKNSQLIVTLKNNLNQDKTGFESSGLSLFKTEHWQDLGEAWTNAFVQFGEGAGLIFRTLGGLFVGQGWENVGSIVSIYTSTSSILSDMGVSYFIYYWGLISVNLAIFNLLPFPGLDGWQLLVIAIEGISRKKVPEKAKSIMSFIVLPWIK